MKFISQFLFFTFIVAPFLLVCILLGIVGKEHKDTLRKIRGDK